MVGIRVHTVDDALRGMQHQRVDFEPIVQALILRLVVLAELEALVLLLVGEVGQGTHFLVLDLLDLL